MGVPPITAATVGTEVGSPLRAGPGNPGQRAAAVAWIATVSTATRWASPRSETEALSLASKTRGASFDRTSTSPSTTATCVVPLPSTSSAKSVP